MGSFNWSEGKGYSDLFPAADVSYQAEKIPQLSQTTIDFLWNINWGCLTGTRQQFSSKTQISDFVSVVRKPYRSTSRWFILRHTLVGPRSVSRAVVNHSLPILDESTVEPDSLLVWPKAS
ncbi:hypothetical protein ElyMa_005106400 [Elysia marginata]|uniref:Uncharacterized protein n=1 Tax=Elysia marginata TaxID=1093978 RepID=A0AAV4JLD2_9GAST|nr:hypothetical protein ElyMa_005106400 [Elysia marginata]